MALNLTKLDNVSKLDLNTSVLDGNLINNSFDKTFAVLGDVYSYTIFIVIFIFLFYTFYRVDGAMRYDLFRALSMSSGITMIMSIVMLSVGFATTFKPVVIMGIIFIFSSYFALKENR